MSPGSRLFNPKRHGDRDPLPWQKISLVRLRCHEEGLELAVELDDLRIPVPQSDKGRAREFEEIRDAVEGEYPDYFAFC